MFLEVEISPLINRKPTYFEHIPEGCNIAYLFLPSNIPHLFSKS